ncbi:MFS transporter [Opitutus sp. ER46]|uniref:MFS transporter n=1 Tax=Opitutus sp. ER46 TaxID=2161864 RepID=UPI000D2FF6E3|nr:MFS transporter [Opitutus sp. ER46]PTX90960.1 MFS transporter [Opitutus sp. ER46]
MSIPRPSRRAWWLLLLLFGIGLLNYLDRQTLSILKATLKVELALTDIHYSWLVTAFMAPYILFYVVSGRLVDRFGTRRSLSAFVGIWSVANILCGCAQNLAQLAGARALLGAAEPGAFPAIQRVMMTWFPPERRAFAWSLLSPCTTVGAILAPPLVALLTTTWSWHWAFILPGVVGCVLAAGWWLTDRNPPAASGAAEAEPAAVPLRTILGDTRVWILLGARAVTDPVWYFHLFWLPGYLQERIGVSLSQLGWIGWIPSFVASLAVILTGRITDFFVARGRPPARVRVTMFALAAAFAPLGAFTTFAPSLLWALVLISAVAIICQIWFFGQGLLVADIFPRNSAATIAGLLGAVGASGGLLMNLVAGPLIQHIGYVPVFIGLACLHPLAAVLLWRTLPRLVRAA